MLNNINVMGRLTKDPEMRTTNTGKFVTSFTLAVDRDFEKDKADFFQCVAWNKTAEFVNRYFTKGQLVVVSGSMQSREWKDQKDNKRLSWEIKVSNVYFAESRRQVEVEATDFKEIEDEGELPF